VSTQILGGLLNRDTEKLDHGAKANKWERATETSGNWEGSPSTLAVDVKTVAFDMNFSRFGNASRVFRWLSRSQMHPRK
jgi:hypothetical protein